MNKENGHYKIIAGMAILAILFFAILAKSGMAKILILALLHGATISIYLIIFGMIDLVGALENEKRASIKKNALVGNNLCANDMRIAFGAEVLHFLAKQIFPITDKEKHPCSALVQIDVIKATARSGEVINVASDKKWIVTGQNLIENIKYYIDASGVIKPSD